MKILVVSDTHGKDENLDQVLMREAPFDMLLHCGDVEGREDYIEAAAECETYMVSGNNDFISDLPAFEVIELRKHRIFLTHGHGYGVSWDFDRLTAAAASRNCDVALFGHIHVPLDMEMDGIRCLNPGSLTFPRQQGRRPSYIVMTEDSSGELHADIRYL